MCVKAPGFGDRRKEMLQDIAILTGGQVISTDLGMELKDTTLAQLGRARQVKVTKETTTIVEGAGAKDDIQARIAQIRAQIETTTSEYDKEKLHQGRRCDRDRDEGKEAAHRGRAQRDPRSRRRGHRGRRRHGVCRGQQGRTGCRCQALRR